MGTVTVNSPKTPVTRGSSGVASATLPNVCKMPGPPAPFVPTPLPNVGQSSDSPHGYSKQVQIEGQAVAIAGASFGSKGDIASKATGGGIVSSNTHGPTRFLGPGSFDVRIEGKNVQLLSDPTLNNCGPSGSPANAATMTGVMQTSGSVAVIYCDDTACPLCHKTHPIPEGPAALKVMGPLFHDLRKELAKQRPKIKRLDEVARELNVATTNLRKLDPVQLAKLPALRAECAALTNYFDSDALFRKKGRTYAFGYMVGVLICRCKAKKLIACSGTTPPGFRRIAAKQGFTVVEDGFQPSPAQQSVLQALGRGKWECAAPKLIQAAGGHKAVALCEKTFNPLGDGPTVSFRCINLAGQEISMSHTFRAGESVPSCDKGCQQLLPEMVCKTKC